MKRLKQIISMVLAAVLLIGSLSLTAVAAETSNAVKIQLDGEFITLKDNAAPILKDGRVYLPFRSLFETLGAEVSWDKNTGIISAAKNGRTVEFTGGQNAMVIKENGSSRMVNTSAAPYIANGRTMLSVRFAGEALGYNIGWDSENKAVVMIDTDKLVKKLDGKMTYLQKALDMNSEYRDKNIRYVSSGYFMIANNKREDFLEIYLSNLGLQNTDGKEIFMISLADGGYLSDTYGYAADGYRRINVFEDEEAIMRCFINQNDGAVYLRSDYLNQQAGINKDTAVWFTADLDTAAQTFKDMNYLPNTIFMEKDITNIHNLIVAWLNGAEINSIKDYDRYLSYIYLLQNTLGDETFRYIAAENFYTNQNDNLYAEFSLDDKEKMDYFWIELYLDEKMHIQVDWEKGRLNLYLDTGDELLDVYLDMSIMWRQTDEIIRDNPLEYDFTAIVMPLEKISALF